MIGVALLPLAERASRDAHRPLRAPHRRRRSERVRPARPRRGRVRRACTGCGVAPAIVDKEVIEAIKAAPDRGRARRGVAGRDRRAARRRRRVSSRTRSSAPPATAAGSTALVGHLGVLDERGMPRAVGARAGGAGPALHRLRAAPGPARLLGQAGEAGGEGDRAGAPPTSRHGPPRGERRGSRLSGAARQLSDALSRRRHRARGSPSPAAAARATRTTRLPSRSARPTSAWFAPGRRRSAATTSAPRPRCSPAGRSSSRAGPSACGPGARRSPSTSRSRAAERSPACGTRATARWPRSG